MGVDGTAVRLLQVTHVRHILVGLQHFLGTNLRPSKNERTVPAAKDPAEGAVEVRADLGMEGVQTGVPAPLKEDASPASAAEGTGTGQSRFTA